MKKRVYIPVSVRKFLTRYNESRPDSLIVLIPKKRSIEVYERFNGNETYLGNVYMLSNCEYYFSAQLRMGNFSIWRRVCSVLGSNGLILNW